MKTTSSKEISQLLVAWGNGDQAALDKLTPIVYDELHRMAAGHSSRKIQATLFRHLL